MCRMTTQPPAARAPVPLTSTPHSANCRQKSVEMRRGVALLCASLRVPPSMLLFPLKTAAGAGGGAGHWGWRGAACDQRQPAALQAGLAQRAAAA